MFRFVLQGHERVKEPIKEEGMMCSEAQMEATQPPKWRVNSQSGLDYRDKKARVIIQCLVDRWIMLQILMYFFFPSRRREVLERFSLPVCEWVGGCFIVKKD